MEEGVSYMLIGLMVALLVLPWAVIVFSPVLIIGLGLTAIYVWITKAPPKRVLIVDDNPDTTVLIDRFIRGHRAEVIYARTGLEAVTALSKNHFDLVILDYMLPEMNGPEIISLMESLFEKKYSRRHQTTNAIPVIMYSSGDEFDFWQPHLRYFRTVEKISKNLSIRQLNQRMTEVLEKLNFEASIRAHA